MKQILSDYYKHYMGVTISNICLIIFIPVICVLNGISWESTSGKIILALYIIAEVMGVWSLTERFLMIPQTLKKQLAEMPRSESNDIITQYPKAKHVDKHRYMEEHFVFFASDRIYLLRYSDIQAAQLRSLQLKLKANGYKKLITMPFRDHGTNAVALAFLRGKNPDITIITPERTNTK